jgi:hypothetical protein
MLRNVSSVSLSSVPPLLNQLAIRIASTAPNQTALLQITDIGTGTFQRTSFAIAQSTGSSPGNDAVGAACSAGYEPDEVHEPGRAWCRRTTRREKAKAAPGTPVSATGR